MAETKVSRKAVRKARWMVVKLVELTASLKVGSMDETRAEQKENLTAAQKADPMVSQMAAMMGQY